MPVGQNLLGRTLPDMRRGQQVAAARVPPETAARRTEPHLREFQHFRGTIPEAEQYPALPDPAVKLIAFYLPQFHPIPENDRWWGPGFTEWTNVTAAQPLFRGHDQPHRPGELGYYDLRAPEVMQRQIALAGQYGIQGFCFHYYWFGGKRLLERPLDMFLNHPEWDMPFCLCWANENWTRRWDGQDQEVLIAQEHSPQDDLDCLADLLRYVRDPRYLRVDGRPVLIVYRVDMLPDARATSERWRQACRNAGVGEILLVAALTFGVTDPLAFGFDAGVEFPPHGAVTDPLQVDDLAQGFRGHIGDYRDLARGNGSTPSCRIFRAVCPSWDNTARRGRSAYIFAGSTPDLYAEWLDSAVQYTIDNSPPSERLVFVNAWNEWAEGAHLEPDQRWGYGYLNATARVLGRYEPRGGPSAARPPSGSVAPQSPSVSRQEVSEPCPRPAAGPKIRPARHVSVVVPAYNHAAYIERALQSVAAQRLPAGVSLEVIVVDDGSTDGTPDRVKHFMAGHPDLDIRLFPQRNSGAHGAINRGVELSQGFYISLLNSDDEYAPDRIETAYQALLQTGQSFCFSDFEVIDDRSREIGMEHAYVRHLRENIARITTCPSLSYSLLRFNSTISTGNMFFTRGLFDRIGGFCDLEYCHDWDFALSALAFTVPVRLEQKLYRYRLHGANTILQLDSRRADEDSRAVLEKAALRMLGERRPGTYPAFTESRAYLAEFLGVDVEMLDEVSQPRRVWTKLKQRLASRIRRRFQRRAA